MIKGIGIDLCDIERMKKAAARAGFVERLFSKNEIAYAGDRADAALHYAAAFAAKEALAKAGGWGRGRAAPHAPVRIFRAVSRAGSPPPSRIRRDAVLSA